MTLETVLEQIGLTKKEVAVYLAVLELGQSTVLRIAKKAAIKRPTAYVTLTALQEKGFVLSIPKGTTTLYQAVDPEEIFRRSNERVGALRQSLPELRSLFNAAPGKPKVRFYEGKKNILALYENEVFRAKDILSIVKMQDVRKILSHEEVMGLLRLMKANGISIRDLLEDSPEANEYLNEKSRLTLGETKFLPKDLQFGVDILIYGNVVAMTSPRNIIAVVIEDAAIAGAQRQLFEFLWKSI